MQLQERLPLLFGNLAVGDERVDEGDAAKFMDGMLSRQDPDYASNPDIKWNFTKFLIDRKGRVVARFEPMVTPAELASSIEEQL